MVFSCEIQTWSDEDDDDDDDDDIKNMKMNEKWKE